MLQQLRVLLINWDEKIELYSHYECARMAVLGYYLHIVQTKTNLVQIEIFQCAMHMWNRPTMWKQTRTCQNVFWLMCRVCSFHLNEWVILEFWIHLYDMSMVHPHRTAGMAVES